MLPAIFRCEEHSMTVPDTTAPDATAHETRTDVVPPPRTPAPPTGEAAWLEPWLIRRGARPRSEYWDVATARWTSRPAVPAPRRGD
jgi:hypothetical protein